MKIFKIIVWVIGILITSYLLFVVMFVFTPDINNLLNRTEFDSEKWVTWKESEQKPSLRWNMIKSLTSKHELVGMTVTEVKDLLGEPDKETNIFLFYYLGMSGHRVNTGSLYLTVKNGKITGYNIHQG